jgi:Ca2+-binding EF-hand superfamily protein
MEHATNGYVNHIHFAFVMSDAVYLSQEEIDSLVTFIDDEKSGMIAVSDLFTYMQSSKRIKERADDLTSKYKPKKIKHLKK